MAMGAVKGQAATLQVVVAGALEGIGSTRELLRQAGMRLEQPLCPRYMRSMRFRGGSGGSGSARRFVCELGRTSGSHSVTRRRARREAEGRLAPSKASCAGRGGRPSGTAEREARQS